MRYRGRFISTGILLVGLGMVLAMHGASTAISFLWPIIVALGHLTWFVIGRREGFEYAEELREQRVRELS
jgi:hypothetical protein